MELVVERVLKMLTAGALLGPGDALLPTPIDSVCVHGDTPHAVEMAMRLRAAIESAGWGLRSFAPAAV